MATLCPEDSKMVLKSVITKKFTELLMFEVRCKKRDGGKGRRLSRFRASIIDL